METVLWIAVMIYTIVLRHVLINTFKPKEALMAAISGLLLDSGSFVVVFNMHFDLMMFLLINTHDCWVQ